MGHQYNAWRGLIYLSVMQTFQTRLAWLATAGLVALTACSDSSSSPSEPISSFLAAVDSGYDFSVYLTAPPGDTHRTMVVERGGKIWLLKDGIRQANAFLDLTSLTGQGHEYGVYTIAFHPQYAQNRRLFVYYVDNNANTRVAEFLANPDFDSADPTSRKGILAQTQSATAVLYGGMIAFGSDGKLYVSIGDGDVGGDPLSKAQDSTSLLGKILRLDVDGAAPYEIPPDNPYVGRPGWREEIWQLGLRNPWRWSFDRANGDLYIGDVGENLWEEVDHLPAPVVGGNNFGWPIEEGKNCFQPSAGCFTLGLVEPVFEYPHGLACAVTGGYVYRGQDFPDLQGTYFYGDFCSGVIRSFKLDGEYPQELLPEIQIPLVNGKADNTVSFGEDARGELYAVMASGRIYRVEKR
jgi:glucose/arabinose dehydrogenase